MALGSKTGNFLLHDCNSDARQETLKKGTRWHVEIPYDGVSFSNIREEPTRKMFHCDTPFSK